MADETFPARKCERRIDGPHDWVDIGNDWSRCASCRIVGDGGTEPDDEFKGTRLWDETLKEKAERVRRGDLTPYEREQAGEPWPLCRGGGVNPEHWERGGQYCKAPMHDERPTVWTAPPNAKSEALERLNIPRDAEPPEITEEIRAAARAASAPYRERCALCQHEPHDGICDVSDGCIRCGCVTCPALPRGWREAHGVNVPIPPELDRSDPIAVLKAYDFMVGLCEIYAADLRAAHDEWSDKSLPEDAAISAAFPTRTGRHDLYAEAMRLVGAKHSKGALVALVNWLLAEANRLRDRIDELLNHREQYLSRIETLEAALRPFAEYQKAIDEGTLGSPFDEGIRGEDLRRARAALEKGGGE